MADQKITQLTALTNDTVDVLDVLPIVDVSGGATDKMTYQNMMRPKDNIFGIVDDGDITKIVAFQVSGLTTGTTRTLTVPDADLTLVGTATTQTLTNKTLTAPQINMGSDATGDIYYRTAGGAFARLGIGTSAQILQVSSGGIPEWIANPSVSNASTTAAGIVELATTAETETGTDATRAVTPDGLHDMTTLAGAAWFLDEDTMASDSATKTASQQSIKAYVDTTLGTDVAVIPRPVLPEDGVSTRVLNNNVDAYAYAFKLERKITVNKITFNVTAVGAAGTLNIGIFSQDGQTRHISVTTGSISGTGLVTVAVSAVTLTPGIYYLVVGSVSTASITVSTYADAATISALKLVTSEPRLQGVLTVTASTMPTTFSTSDSGTFQNASDNSMVIRLDN